MSEEILTPTRLAPRVVNTVTGKSRTEKAHQKRVNVNTIVAKANRTGLLPGRSFPGFYGDFTGVSDYRTCVEKLMQAEDNFMALPSKVRKRFNNDPAELLDFLSDDKNRKEAIELGILEKEPYVPNTPPVASPPPPVEPE